jgi:hypothetical protein
MTYIPANADDFDADDSDKDSTDSCSGYEDDEGTILAFERPEVDVDRDGDHDN